LGVAILAIAVFALRHPQGPGTSAGTTTHTPSRTATKSAATTPTSSAPRSSTASHPAAPVKLPLVVLNNTTVPSLASQAAATFEAGGWTVTSVGNLRNDILSTCAYYDPDVVGAQAAATALKAQFPAIKRVQPKFAELPAGPIVVVLTADYTSG
jgi:hypothetical protein